MGITKRAVRKYQALSKRNGLMELINECLGDRQINHKSYVTYRSNLKTLFRYFWSRGITRPQRVHVLKFQEDFLHSGKAGASAKNVFIAAKIFFSWTERNGIYPNIMLDLRLPKLSKEHAKDTISQLDFEKVRRSMPRESMTDERNHTILVLLHGTGMRCIEVERLKLRDYLPPDDEGKAILKVTGKGEIDKSRNLPLNSIVVKELNHWVKLMEGRLKETDPLFPSFSPRSMSAPLRSTSISKMVKASFRRVNLDRDTLSAHSLRHSYATDMIASGRDVKVVQYLLGHRDAKNTLIYVERSQRAVESAVQGYELNVHNARRAYSEGV